MGLWCYTEVSGAQRLEQVLRPHNVAETVTTGGEFQDVGQAAWETFRARTEQQQLAQASAHCGPLILESDK